VTSPVRVRGEETELRHRRTLISQVLVAGLVSVAYSVPIGAVQEAIKHTVSLRTVGLFVVYAITVLRFFIGNVLHLEGAELTRQGGERKWFFDLTFIVSEFIVLIFMGDVASLARSGEQTLTFFDLLFGLCIVDVAWLASMYCLDFLGKWTPREGQTPSWPRRIQVKLTGPFKRERRQFYRGWFLINVGMALGLWLFGFLGHLSSQPPTWKLWVLVIATAAVSAFDVYVLNYNMAERKLSESATEPA
jgi:hypothetical protein